MDEKWELLMSELPLHETVSSPPPKRQLRKSTFSCIALLFALWLLFDIVHITHPSKHHKHHGSSSQCTQVEPILPEHQTAKLIDMDAGLNSSAFEKVSVGRLQGAVQIKTESFDDMGEIGEDKRWDVFYGFAEYLKKTFPLVHDKLDLDVVNTHGLIFTWAGSNPALKPTLLMAHQDTVPVPDATVNAWTHPPFSGHFDGKYIWGRGSSDCLNQLIAILESVEELIGAEFTPTRTVILSFGFDEEISGREGAGHLAPFLLEKYGPDSIATIVDEGATVDDAWGALMATPGVAEKGYTDVVITVRMPGGHSSIPPDHTSIGVISELLQLIEANPYPTHLDSQNPYLGKLQCGAAHAPDFPKKLRHLLESDERDTCSKGDPLALAAAKEGLAIKYLMQTSVAVDTIVGGVKVNALPERVSADVNHRINVGEHPSDVHNKITNLAKGVAKKYNLGLNAFNGVQEAPLSISLSASNTTLEVSPVTPTDVDSVSAYSILSGTTRALYGKDIVVAPGIMTGNTDTRYYWDLTKHIFRYAPGYAPGEDGGLGNIHTVDERVSIKNHINTVKWFSLFIRNMDEADLE
ncbi:carboxypeptidase S [Delphinella strobiligena]|nr:carboxypeptidase S [Delphinella strobiligena]